MTEIRLRYYQDAAHGWLAVKRDLVEHLGISHAITAYSYQRGSQVYLEEDVDMLRFMQAAREQGIRVELERRDHGNRSAIRCFDRYQVAL